MAQIRFFRLLKKMNDKKIAGGLFLADILGCCCETCEIEMERGSYIDWKKKSMEDTGYVEERAPDDYEIESAIEETKSKEVRDYQSVDEEKIKVIALVSKRQKTSIMYVSNRTSLPKERIIEIVLADPDFMIEHEYVINKKMTAKKEISKELCPICKTPFEPSHEFCANCGNILK